MISRTDMSGANTLRVLQVASFTGNIGDNANHLGFRSWFGELLRKPIEWREFEIRRTFWGDSAFDDDFVAQANACDLLVLGGGNFYELWVKDSPSGTSIAISDERLRRIRVPIMVHGLGVDIHQGVADGNVERFRSHLRTLRELNSFITVRNDGAAANLREIGIELAEYDIHEIPDGGFFARFESPAEVSPVRKVGINIAGDMLAQRFPEGGLTYQHFLETLARLIVEFTDEDPQLSFVLFPHIFRDLRVYCDLLELLPDRTRRGRVEVARYAAGDSAARLIFDEYLQCQLLLGMRFHANVVALAHGVPTVGLNTYMQIENLYRELDLTEQLVDVRDANSEARLRELMKRGLASGGRSDDTAVLDTVSAQLHATRSKLRQWLTRSSLASAVSL